MEIIKQKYEKLKASLKASIHRVKIRWCIRYLKRFYKVGYRYDPSTGIHSWHWTDEFEKNLGLQLTDKQKEYYEGKYKDNYKKFLRRYYEGRE